MFSFLKYGYWSTHFITPLELLEGRGKIGSSHAHSTLCGIGALCVVDPETSDIEDKMTLINLTFYDLNVTGLKVNNDNL